MVSIDEELEAAEAAQVAINTLSTSAPNPHIESTLRKAKDMATRAITTFPSERLLNGARHKVVIELSDLIHVLANGPLTQQKIDNAKDAIEDWMNLLKAQH